MSNEVLAWLFNLSGATLSRWT